MRGQVWESFSAPDGGYCVFFNPSNIFATGKVLKIGE